MLIGLAGKAGAGKDYFASVAAEYYPVNRVAFADTLKEEVAQFLDRREVCYSHRHLWGTQADKEATLRVSHYFVNKDSTLSDFVTKYCDYENGYHYFTPRSLLQFWGTDFRRKQDSDYWIKAVYEKVKNNTGITIITDVRFPNEVGMIHSMSGKLVKIVRPDAPGISNMQHESEIILDGLSLYDHVLHNDGTIETYRQTVKDTMELLYGC